VCPGLIDTDMTNWQGAYDLYAGKPGAGPEIMKIAGDSYHALKDAGALDPQVVADTALWLVSDAARTITGASIPVEAGHFLLQGANSGAGF
jgi:NAD(P)-dependent dehydrogenase (short-subunit alcohol dehydrogenase family)